ncbi:hypothetical protein AS594_11585 [Streptomyces agglomeratus]|uniref:Uncharacterized protein n=1 Tax=Streptomyces agglomeratus TaxID=285458 RepID=A0A1E5P682_9ACTN|nr:hypothetical protein [Streptomyces agglomeratus]OEJ25032.1 hypothetical protein AS594_11585 [Streptomyces agglomeratus]OEJ53479.1 hypothetical protein BGK72_24520 [Streptomyces agglomeratus]
MSMPPPQQPPSPYGPPQQPNPYGGQPYPQPQQPQFPQQQSYPGQPHPPQQYPGQGGWGQPPMGQPAMGQPPMMPPPRKSGAGKVIAIVAACLVGIGLIGFVVPRVLEANAVTTGAGFPAAKYRLTVPKTMLDGEFKLAQDLSQTKGKEALAGTYDSKIRNPRPVVGQYTSGTPAELGVLVISGMYGQFKDPESARAKMMAGAEEGEGAAVAVPAKDVTPAGSGITLTCQVLTSTQSGATVTMPMCAWADENTGASVAVVTPETSKQDPASVDLEKIAETTLKVREESRQPIG